MCMHIAYTVKIYLLILIISLFDVGRPSIYSTTLANLLDFYRSFHLLFAFISKYVLYRTVILRIYLSHPVLRPSVRPSVRSSPIIIGDAATAVESASHGGNGAALPFPLSRSSLSLSSSPSLSLFS